MGRAVIHDPGSPPYERARGLLVAELKSLGMDVSAACLKNGDLTQIPPWIAMQVIARLV